MVMPFGLTNTLATFQHYMNELFRDMADEFIVVYLDDILIFSKDESQHKEHVQTVLKQLCRHNLHVKSEMCTFNTDTMTYLSFIVSPEGVSDQPAMSNPLRIATRSHHLIRQGKGGGCRCSVNRPGIDQCRTGG